MPRRAFRLAVAILCTFIGCVPAQGQVAPKESSSRVETTITEKENKAIFEVGGATHFASVGPMGSFLGPRVNGADDLASRANGSLCFVSQ